MTNFTLEIGFKSAAERVRNECVPRLESTRNILTFGVKYLDCATGGIAPHDLVLIAAKTGIGKTSLSTCLALENAKKGKRVHYFVLEDEEFEIERRLKYRLLCDKVYKRLSPTEAAFFNYRDWRYGKYHSALAMLESEIDAQIAREYATLFTYYREKGFCVADLQKIVLAIQNQTDLVIVDHLHYVDHEDFNENRAYRDIVKQIRDLALDIGKPVILVAHLRKSERKDKSLMPTLEDIHGTSDITKIATKVVLLARSPFDSPDPRFANTLMQVAKCRVDGTATRYVATVTWNIRQSTYESNYTLGRLRNFGEQFEALETGKDIFPSWAQESKAA